MESNLSQNSGCKTPCPDLGESLRSMCDKNYIRQIIQLIMYERALCSIIDETFD